MWGADKSAVTAYLMSRLVDGDDQIFSNDFSYITCASCQSLLSVAGQPKTCDCGSSIQCLACQRQKALELNADSFSSETILRLPCGCSKADQALNQVQMAALKAVRVRDFSSGDRKSLPLTDMVKQDLDSSDNQQIWLLSQKPLGCVLCQRISQEPLSHSCNGAGEVLCSQHQKASITKERVANLDVLSDQLFESLACYLCDGLVSAQAVQCTTCEQAFCQSCCAQSLMWLNMCPKCFKGEPIFQKGVPRNVSKILEQFEIVCKYQGTGKCNLNGALPYKELIAHELECASCALCESKCAKCEKMVAKSDMQAHLISCKGPAERDANQGNAGNFFFRLFRRNSRVQTTIEKSQLVAPEDVKPIARLGQQRNPLNIPGLDFDDNFQNAQELIEQQRALIEAIQNRSFWGTRVHNLMQYYPTMSNSTANTMLLIMFLDPFVQNGVLLALFNYILTSPDLGGCCQDTSLFRATWTFIGMYLLVFLITTIGASITWVKVAALPPEGGRQSSCKIFLIATGVFFSLHFFSFGLIPKLHRFFEMREIYAAVKACVHSNVFQVFVLVTLIGLIAMNLRSAKELSPDGTTDEVALLDQRPLWHALSLCIIMICFNVVEFFMIIGQS